jgi:hypothetical protein
VRVYGAVGRRGMRAARLVAQAEPDGVRRTARAGGGAGQPGVVGAVGDVLPAARHGVGAAGTRWPARAVRTVSHRR